MPPVVSVAEVRTDRPARYGKQLVSHLGRKAGGQWSEETETGWITLGTGRADVSCAPGLLLVRLTSPAEPDRLEGVVGGHLVRFGTKDELVVAWRRDDDTAGTTQRHEGTAEEG